MKTNNDELKVVSKEKSAHGGQIWKCIKECRTNKDKGRRVIIEEGEVVEFRYWSPANFRTIKEEYFAVEREDFFAHFVHIGNVFENIRSRNKNTLKQIIDAELYEPVKVVTDPEF